MNEAGVAVAMAYVGRREQRPGVMFHLAVRAVLDRCRTTREAVAFLGGVPHVRNHNFLVADRSGEMAVVEAGPGAVEVSRPKDGVAAITNHFRSERMIPAEDLTGRPPDSERRLEALLGLLGHQDPERGTPVTEEDVRRMLADRESCLCAESKPDDSDEPIVTLWSWTAELGSGELSLASGFPDSVPHEPRRVPGGEPSRAAG